MASKRKCKGCEKLKPKESMIIHGVSAFCDQSCIDKWVFDERKRKQAIKKGEKLREKAERKKHREDLKRVKPLSKFESAAQAAVNMYVRWRDYGLACICCGQTINWTDPNTTHSADAGHFRTRAHARHLRYNTLNIHAQRKTCNGSSFDIHAYEARLVDKIGLQLVERIKHNNEIRRFDRDYLERLARLYRARARRIKKRRLAGITRPVVRVHADELPSAKGRQ